jgi:hypothetical protein
VPEDVAATMPPAAAYEGAVFLTPEEQMAAGSAIKDQWESKVGAEVTR